MFKNTDHCGAWLHINSTISFLHIEFKKKATARRSYILIFLLARHKVDFISPCGVKKYIFWPPRRKKIVCVTGKKFILLVWFLPLLCSSIKFHTRKINFFSPTHTQKFLTRNRMADAADSFFQSNLFPKVRKTAEMSWIFEWDRAFESMGPIVWWISKKKVEDLV